MIEYELTETEYLFWIPAEEISKARAIAGGELDKVRGCWTFPRTPQVCESLRKAFGKKAKQRSRSQQPKGLEPTAARSKELEAIQKELTARQLEIEELRRTLQEQAKRISDHEQAEVTAHETILALKKQHAQALDEAQTVANQKCASLEAEHERAEINAKEALLTFKRQYKQVYDEADVAACQKLAALEAEQKKAAAAAQQVLLAVKKQYKQVSDAAELALKQKIATLEQELAQARYEGDQIGIEGIGNISIVAVIKQFALEASGSSPAFGALLERCTFNEFLPIQVKNELEVVLFSVIGTPVDGRDLTELIHVIKDRNLLHKEDVELLYLIRNQRNAAAHSRRPKEYLQTCGVLSLLAIAVLWPKIAKQE